MIKTYTLPVSKQAITITLIFVAKDVPNNPTEQRSAHMAIVTRGCTILVTAPDTRPENRKKNKKNSITNDETKHMSKKSKSTADDFLED